MTSLEALALMRDMTGTAERLDQVHLADCVDLLDSLGPETVDLVFADPPFNIGYDYDVYEDRRSDDSYVEWCSAWMARVKRVLVPDGTFWLAIGDEYAAELNVAAKRLGFHLRSWVVWYYTFGVNCKQKFTRSHAHLFHFVKDTGHYTFNRDAILVPSARQTVYGDKRASAGGRLPDDTWILRPQDCPNGFTSDEDVWHFPRVAGTFKERRGFHGCQMPEALLERVIRVSSHPGQIVFDPFCGSGTTAAVAKRLGRHWITCDVSTTYVDGATKRLNSLTEIM